MGFKAPGVDQGQTAFPMQGVAELRLLWHQGQRRLQLSIGKMTEAVAVSTHFQKPFEGGVVRIQIVVVDRPVLAISIVIGCLEFVVR